MTLTGIRDWSTLVLEKSARNRYESARVEAVLFELRALRRQHNE